MSIVDEILQHNKHFVESREYEAFRTDRFPNKKLVVVTCMDTRLVEMLPRAMNLCNGDVKMIKVAGAVVSHPFGSVMRSILVAVYELGAEEVIIVGHHQCGMVNLNSQRILEKVKASGVSPDVLNTLDHAGINLQAWLTGFTIIEEAVRQSVSMVRNHPLMPKKLPVHGMVMDPDSGKIDLLIDGYAGQ